MLSLPAARFRRRRRGRQAKAPVPPPPPPPVQRHVTSVVVQGGSEFDWTVYWEFDDDLPPSLTLADVAGFRVDSTPPAFIEDADANWVVCRFHSDQGPGAPWTILPGGSPIFVPGESGVVG